MADNFRVPLIDDTGGGEFPRPRSGFNINLTFASDLTRDGVTLIPAGVVTWEAAYQTRSWGVNITQLKPIIDTGFIFGGKTFTPSGSPTQVTIGGAFYIGNNTQSPVPLPNQGDYHVDFGISSPTPYRATWDYTTTPNPGNGPTVLVNTGSNGFGVSVSIPTITWSFA